MEKEYEFEPTQSEIDEEYNRNYFLEIELKEIIKENKENEKKGINKK